MAGDIDAARKTVEVAVYSVTHPRIAKAHRRGVKVRVLLDKSQSSGRYSSATYLHNAGVPIWTDSAAGLMHHKVGIIDGRTIITGSFNWTRGGDEANSKNMLVIENKPKLVAAYHPHS